MQMNTPKLPGDARWEEKDLRALVEKAASYGLELEAIENVPTHFYHKAMLGLPGRDEQIENYRTTLRNMGRAGIPILGFHFMPNSVWRTERFAPGRGGAGCTQVRHGRGREPRRARTSGGNTFPPSLGWQETMPLRGKGEAVITEEEMWANYTYFIKAVLPVAEEAGVKMALHPDDPPVPMLGGVARLFYKPENFKRAWEINPTSEAWGLDLCLGCCSEMPGGAANVTRDDRVLRAEGTASSTSISGTSRAQCRTSPSASSARAISIRRR